MKTESESKSESTSTLLINPWLLKRRGPKPGFKKGSLSKTAIEAKARAERMAIKKPLQEARKAEKAKEAERQKAKALAREIRDAAKLLIPKKRRVLTTMEKALRDDKLAARQERKDFKALPREQRVAKLEAELSLVTERVLELTAQVGRGIAVLGPNPDPEEVQEAKTLETLLKEVKKQRYKLLAKIKKERLN